MGRPRRLHLVRRRTSSGSEHGTTHLDLAGLRRQRGAVPVAPDAIARCEHACRDSCLRNGYRNSVEHNAAFTAAGIDDGDYVGPAAPLPAHGGVLLLPRAALHLRLHAAPGAHGGVGRQAGHAAGHAGDGDRGGQVGRPLHRLHHRRDDRRVPHAVGPAQAIHRGAVADLHVLHDHVRVRAEHGLRDGLGGDGGAAAVRRPRVGQLVDRVPGADGVPRGGDRARRSAAAERDGGAAGGARHLLRRRDVRVLHPLLLLLLPLRLHGDADPVRRPRDGAHRRLQLALHPLRHEDALPVHRLRAPQRDPRRPRLVVR